MIAHYVGSAGQRYFDARRYSRLPTVQARKAARVKPYINGSGAVLDFGCGDGELLANIPAPVRIGIEINPPSVAEARARGIEVYESLSDVADGVATTVIASHSLEHVIDPAGTLAEFRRILAANSTLIIVLPAENPGLRKFRWDPADHNKHLYSWTPLSIGNLAHASGFRVERCFRVAVGESRYVNWLPGPLAGLARKLLALAIRRRIDIICVAVKE